MATITGTGNDDVLDGGSGDDILYGGAGADDLDGGNGSDTVYGGSGDDILHESNSRDTIYGGAGNDDIIVGASNSQLVYGGAGADTIQAGAGNGNALFGGDGDDIIDTGSGNSVSLSGGAGNDTLSGGAGSGTYNGGVGDDRITTGNGSDTIVVEFGFGDDVVTDFDDGQDTVSVRVGGITNFSDIQARMTDVGGDTQITFDNGSTLLLQGVTPGDLSSSNFIINPVCFASGTLIETSGGPRPVEDLSVGDKVVTNHAGPQPIRWIGCTTHCWPGTDEKHKPIMIRAGALGGGLPLRDLVVSPQHRLLFTGIGFLPGQTV